MVSGCYGRMNNSWRRNGRGRYGDGRRPKGTKITIETINVENNVMKFGRYSGKSKPAEECGQSKPYKRNRIPSSSQATTAASMEESSSTVNTDVVTPSESPRVRRMARKPKKRISKKLIFILL